MNQLHEKRWYKMIEILDRISGGHRFEEFHQYSSNVLTTMKSTEGWIVVGFMGLLPIIEKELNKEEEVFFSYGYDHKLVAHFGNINYNDLDVSLLLDHVAVYFGVSTDILIKIAGYQQTVMTFESKRKFKTNNQVIPRYPIPAPWNTHRPDILLNPISPHVVSMNISAMLNWETCGQKCSNSRIYWSYATLN